MKKTKTSTFSAITSSESNEWYTPEWLINIARNFYGGEIDLDPASCDLAQSWIKAQNYFTIKEDGFLQPKKWQGRIWLNPPYGSKSPSNYGSGAWCGVALGMFAQNKVFRIPTEFLILVGGNSEGKRNCQKHGLTLQFYQRIKFIDHKGYEQKSPPPAPDLIYLGDRKQEFINHFGYLGLINQVIN